MAETKINKLPVLERRLHNYGHGMDFPLVSGKRFFPIGCQAHPTRKIKATKEGAAGLEVVSLAGKKNRQTKYLAQTGKNG